MDKSCFLLLALLFSSSMVNAQFAFERKDSITVVNGLDTLIMPWAGGFNNPQFSSIDLDQDGVKDVFVYDRSSDYPRTFVYKNEGGTMVLKHDPSYETKFPISGMRYRTLLVDYNCDGKEDIFTYTLNGFKIYKNVSNVVDGLQWELEISQLTSLQYGVEGNVYSSGDDIAAITDVDNDGDIDILAFASNNELVEYHRNYAMETLGRCDTLVLELKNDCWGLFREEIASSSIILNDGTFPCTGTTIVNPNKTGAQHAGSTLLAIDIDNSGVKDLIIGDASTNNLVLLTNSGLTVNSNSAMNTIDLNFPSNSVPVDIITFPASFHLDLDNDGVKDLVAAPNYKSLSHNYESAWWYKNTNTNGLPVFEFQSKTYLQEDMIDVGAGAIPVFFDYNDDGLEDLIVSNFFNFVDPNKKKSRLSLYENIGTTLNPVYNFITADYHNLSASGIELRLTPTFGDIDGDGDSDMYVGCQNGFVRFYRNSAGAGVEANFNQESLQILDHVGAPIDVGSYSAPTLVDLNKDNLMDLVIGDKKGYLHYYQNIGTSSVPSYQLISDSLGKVDTSPLSNEGYAYPKFIEINGEYHLFLGAKDGFVHYYDGIEGNISHGDSFNLVSHEYLDIRNGNYSALDIKDIDADLRLEMLFGNDLGGLAHFKGETYDTTLFISDVEMNEIKVFPNPSMDWINIQFDLSSFSDLNNRNLLLFSLDGRLLRRKTINNTVEKIDLTGLPSGVFILNIEGTNYREKVVKQ